MTEELTLKATQIGIFNPGRLSDEEIERAFITRIKVFEYLLEGIVTESPDAIPQHYLIIGQRGMGKSTMLHRIAVELRKEQHRSAFIPLTFPEEQYNVDRLSKFWLNCLDSLADALDREGSDSELAQLDRDINKLTLDSKAISAMDMYAHLARWTERIGRRLVLLVDNLGLIFESLSKAEQHQLRAILMANGAPILVGASAGTIADTVDYGAPFYDAFQVQYLKKLNFEETMDVLRNLAEITNNPAFVNEISANRARLRTIYQLTGGTPRTVVMLYPLIKDGFSAEVQNDLEGMMDMMTPLYKARFEELPKQLQVILDAVALHWDPLVLDDLRQITQLENSQLSPQLKRLTEVGWIEKLSAYQKKGSAYQISERFFNVWYLMRRSSRRHKKELLCLTKFLVMLYGEELPKVGQLALLNKALHRDQVSLQLAIAGGVRDMELAERLKRKSYEELFEILNRDSSILRDFEIPSEVVNEKELELMKTAIDLLRANNWLGARDACEKLLMLNPSNEWGWEMTGHLNASYIKEYAEAERAFLRAVNINTQNASLWNELGDLYQLHLERYEEAEEAYLKSIEIDEQQASTWYTLGGLYQNYLDKYEESEKAYLKAIEIDNMSAFVWNGLGTLYQYELDRYEDAEAAYLKAVGLDEKYTYPWYNLGHLYQHNLNRYIEAEQAYLKGLEIDKQEDADVWYYLGNLYQYNLGRYEEAEQAYIKAVEIDGQNAGPWEALGNLYLFNLNKYEESEQAYLRATELDDQDPILWSGLGLLYHLHLNQTSNAERAYLRAIEIEDQKAFPWFGLGEIYQYDLINYQKAERAYLNAIEIEEKMLSSKENLVFLYKLNLMFLYRDKMNQLEKAKKLFKQLEVPDEEKDRYWLNASLFEMYNSNYGMAKNYMFKALEFVGDQLPIGMHNDWWLFAAVSTRLGLGQVVLEALSENGYDILFRPYYVAIQSLLAEDSTAFLNSVAVEVRDVAADLLERIKQFM